MRAKHTPGKPPIDPLTAGQAIVDWAGRQPAQLLILVPMFAFLESCIGIGLFVSGAFLLATGVLLYSVAPALLPVMAGLSFCGALAGDHTGYLIGYTFGPQIRAHPWLRKHEKRTARIQDTIARSSPWAICIGRLSPTIRSLTPLAAGLAGLKPLRFLACDLLACSLWTAGLSTLVVALNQV